MRGGRCSHGTPRLSSSVDPSPHSNIPNEAEGSSHPTSIAASIDPIIHDGSSTHSDIPDVSTHSTIPDGASQPLPSDHALNEHLETAPVQPILVSPTPNTKPYIAIHNNTFLPLKPAYETVKHIIHSHYDGVYI